MKLGYYPGCSLHATAREFDQSLRAVAAPLELELEEVRDWSCCGASSAHATDHQLAIALSARNLSLAEAQGLSTVMAPCAACFSRLAAARHAMESDAVLAKRIGGMLKRPFQNSVTVQNVLEPLRERAEALRAKATGRLAGLKVACYYGCLLVRPAELSGEDCEDPRSMETIAAAAGATPVAWNKRLDCCGGSLSLSRTGSVVRLGRAIIDDARAAGAQAIVVACPMCHSNLDLRQKAMAERGAELGMPILFLTQLVGLGLGLEPEALGLDRHFTSTRPVLEHTPAAREAARA